MSGRQLVLAIRLSESTATKLAPVFARAELEVEAVSSESQACRLLELVRFDSILIDAPEPDDDLQTLLGAIRQPACRSYGANVLLLLQPEEMPLARAYLSAGASQIVPAAFGATELQAVVLRSLRAKARISLRALVQLTVELKGNPARLLCQTRDISRNGMFVLTDPGFPPGTAIHFALNLPQNGVPIGGEAEVVRASVGKGSLPEGLGLRFRSFAGDGESRLSAFLDRLRGVGGESSR